MYFFAVAVFVFASPGIVLAATAIAANQELPDPDIDNFIPSLDDDSRLDWILIKHVASSLEDNFLLSPIGLKFIMSLLKEAATGETLAELSVISREDLNRVDIRSKFQKIIELLKKRAPENIAHLNSWIFIPAHFVKRQLLTAIGKEYYNTNITSVTTQNPTETVKEINSEIFNVTTGNILKPVNEDDVMELKMLILNTLYFDGNWRHRFPLTATQASEFYITPSLLKVVPVMNIVQNFYYAESTKLDAKILRMPYKSTTFAMYLIVPNSLTGLSYVVENIRLIPSELEFLENHIVDVTLPKFKFAYTCYLDKALKEMGLSSAFSDLAMFPGVARGQYLEKRVKISKVMQRSFINVNERGTGVLSATGMTTNSNLETDINKIREVVANRPFIFFIKDEATKELFVLGKVADPTL